MAPSREHLASACSTKERGIKATYWFNCNPEHPYHWFYKEWIQKAAEKQVLYLHFQMTDNPSLSPAVLRRYKRLYSGTFYRRFVEGRWVAADGLVYPMFDPKRHVGAPAAPAGPWYLSCDYGTVNPFSLGLWCRDGDAWCRVAEYYHSGRATGVQLTDEEYYAHLCELAGDRPIAALIIDPSAASCKRADPPGARSAPHSSPLLLFWRPLWNESVPKHHFLSTARAHTPPGSSPFNTVETK